MRDHLVRHAAVVLLIAAAMTIGTGATPRAAGAQAKTAGGVLEGNTTADGRIRVFKGVPFAAPPVGARRWQPPHPVTAWDGVRQATQFGARCLQGRIFPDMVFRDEPSEDCLYLNVWTPAAAAADRVPVMVWIHGGGFQAGSASEPRQDGEALARKGVLVVTFNYRLGVFGFLAHPDLTRESGHGASGNYGLLDQIAALRWVQENVAAFGGDPGNVTVFGESAGSFAISALMASPLGAGLFHRAIGESGAFFTTGEGTLTLRPLPATEAEGARFAAALGASSIGALREKSGADVLQASLETQPWFAPNVDGYALPRDVHAAFASGGQMRVPLLAGWNADEIRAGIVLAKEKTTTQSFIDRTRKRFVEQADAVLEAYPHGTDAEALESAAALASDLFIGYGTWKWIDTHARTARVPVYRYSFDRKIPVAPDTIVNGMPATSRDVGARHAGEIEYVFGTLDSLPKVPWEPADRRLSDAMMSYWANFARTGDPNGAQLATWPRYDGAGEVLHLDETIRAGRDSRRLRYEALDAYMARLRAR